MKILPLCNATGVIRGPAAHRDLGFVEKSRQEKPSSYFKQRQTRLSKRFNASLVEFSPDDFSIERLVGTYGVMTFSSIVPGSESVTSENKAAGFGLSELNRMAGVDVGQGSLQVKLYKARIITRGERLGTRVILKAYPGRLTGGIDADAMAANELRTHAILQEKRETKISQNVSYLFGGFQSSTGEQWLVFKDEGPFTAVTYAQKAAEATRDKQALGQWEFLDRFDPNRPLTRRKVFITKMFRGIISGLSFVHSRDRLHQSLGPASIILNTIDELEISYLFPKLRDFAFSVDISDESLFKSVESSFNASDRMTAVSDSSAGLWRRARSAGATSAFERKAFAIADDIYAAGLLLAYLIFIPLSQPGSIDGPSLQRLLETTFRLDLSAARDYCAEDERWSEAVAFLDINGGSGWELLQAMLNPEYRKRPTADTVLRHPFLSIFT